MRLGLILLTLLFAVLGAVFGALNSDAIAFDFYFDIIHAPKGAAFICALLLGWLSGGLVVYLGMVLRLRRRVRTLTRELKQRDRAVADLNPADVNRTVVKPADVKQTDVKPADAKLAAIADHSA
jgi:lipopolysaccharide assembly protein A